jgi:uncharacterized protein (TIGR02271 family)
MIHASCTNLRNFAYGDNLTLWWNPHDAREGNVKDKNEKANKTELEDQHVIPVAEEELKIGKQTRRSGVTRITKTVLEKTEVVDEPLMADEVQVERIPVNKFVEGPVPVREENETTIIPVLEEVLVTQKKILLKEELHIRKRIKTVHKPQKVLLRSEKAVVEHLQKQDHTKQHKP